MDGIITSLLTAFVSGGPQAIIAMLLLVIVALLWDRRRLTESINKQDVKIDKIIHDYYQGNLSLAEALNSLKAVLFEIKSRI